MDDLILEYRRRLIVDTKATIHEMLIKGYLRFVPIVETVTHACNFNQEDRRHTDRDRRGRCDAFIFKVCLLQSIRSRIFTCGVCDRKDVSRATYSLPTGWIWNLESDGSSRPKCGRCVADDLVNSIASSFIPS